MVATRSPSILEACSDPALLGVTLYPAQAELLDQIGGGRFQEVVAAWGRRSGKTLVAAIVAVHSAVFDDLGEYLRPRERRHVLLVAASQQQALIALDYCRELLEGSPALASAIVASDAESVTVRQPATGARVTIRALPCSARSGRGYAASPVVLDEIAHWTTDGEGPAVAGRVYRSLRPSIVQFRERGRALLISSPWGQSGVFHERYQQAASGDHPEMLASNRATWEVNPLLGREALEAEARRDPLGFESEYAATFSAGGDALIPGEALRPRRRGPIMPGDDRLGVAWVALDAAFTRDAFAAVVVARDREDAERLRLAAVRVWRPAPGRPLDFDATLAEVVALARSYGAVRVLTDQHAGQPIVQRLYKSGVAASVVTLTAQTKPAGWVALRGALVDQVLDLYQHDDLLAELRSLTVFYGSGGRQDVRQPRTGQGHADIASALMLGVAEAPRVAVPMRVSSPARYRLPGAERRGAGDLADAWANARRRG